ncbi:hypothetical protein CJ030_MR2G010250 [Morella rubra]|uniref:Uncharacterized protein n=1 Tax=Morella rubra TaxID=262757 RepID=A0A6A1WCQ3_9ROSI|nr:hypothetical protein CJ030_MR2G010250 [Morella rubra]
MEVPQRREHHGTPGKRERMAKRGEKTGQHQMVEKGTLGNRFVLPCCACGPSTSKKFLDLDAISTEPKALKRAKRRKIVQIPAIKVMDGREERDGIPPDKSGRWRVGRKRKGRDVEVAPFSQACSLLSPLIGSLGIAFKFAEMDYTDKKRSEQNKKNRSKLTVNHAAGSRSFQRTRACMERMDAFQRQCDLEGKTYTEIEVYSEILGKKSGYVRGLGRRLSLRLHQL